MNIIPELKWRQLYWFESGSKCNINVRQDIVATARTSYVHILFLVFMFLRVRLFAQIQTVISKTFLYKRKTRPPPPQVSGGGHIKTFQKCSWVIFEHGPLYGVTPHPGGVRSTDTSHIDLRVS